MRGRERRDFVFASPGTVMFLIKPPKSPFKKGGVDENNRCNPDLLQIFVL
jgi:hypothetical protein